MIVEQLVSSNSKKKDSFEAKDVPGKKSLDLILEEIISLKRQSSLEKTASKKKSNK
jgi:hypothetical protein